MPVDEEYLQRLMRTISHDMGGSLRTAVGFSKLIMDNYSDSLDEKAIKWLSMIKSEGEKTQDKLAALSRYARLYGISDSQSACDLTALCRQAMKDSSMGEFYPDFTVTIEQLPSVMGYERLWMDYFLEILTNSARYSGGAPSIVCKVFATESEGQINIVIQDNGVGMTKKQIEMAMEPFRSAEGPIQSGAGMGLPIAKRIAELQGGSIKLHADMQGQDSGLAVVVTLPKNLLVNSEG